MKIIGISSPAYGHNILKLSLELAQKEAIRKEERIIIPLLDGRELDTKVIMINPRYYQDYACVDERIANKIKAGKIAKAPELPEMVKGPCSCDIVIQTEEDSRIIAVEGRTYEDYLESTKPYVQEEICICPYKELLHMGKESIYDNIDMEKSKEIPDIVIEYLKTRQFYAVCMGIYEHPFKKGVSLCGPYMYFDGKYYWERDTWKYVVKYGLTLPQEFIDHVMSEEGQKFLDDYKVSTQKTAYDSMEEAMSDRPHLNLMPTDGGDIPLDKF